jgi:hypothetical protein
MRAIAGYLEPGPAVNGCQAGLYGSHRRWAARRSLSGSSSSRRGSRTLHTSGARIRPTRAHRIAREKDMTGWQGRLTFLGFLPHSHSGRHRTHTNPHTAHLGRSITGGLGDAACKPQRSAGTLFGRGVLRSARRQLPDLSCLSPRQRARRLLGRSSKAPTRIAGRCCED